MEYGLGKLEEMSRMEYGAANKDELVDIETVHIDPDLPPAERLLNYLEQIKNPYCFRCGDTACGSVLPLMATICKISLKGTLQA